MRIDKLNDGQDPYEFEEYAMGENVRVGNDETESNGRRFQDTPPDFAATMRSLRVDLQSCREYNERMLKAQEDQNQINAAILQSLIDIQGQINSRHQTANPKRTKSSARGDSRKRSHVSRRASRDRRNTPEWPTSGSSDSEEPSGDSSSPSCKNKRRICYKNNSRDEFKKARPPTFNGEVKTSQSRLGFLG